MKGIYLGSYIAYHKNHDIVYQDINGKRDLDGDMMNIDLTPYDYIIATPPCNWWSRGNYRRNQSEYALKTKHLLPDIIDKLILLGKPFIVENVRNATFYSKYGLFDKKCIIVFIGRHTYWTNIPFKFDDIIQNAKTEIIDGKKYYRSSQNIPQNKRQGTEEVHEVIERWLETIERRKI